MKEQIKKCLSIFGRGVCIVSILNGICGIIITSIVKNENKILLVDESLKSLKEVIPTVLFVLAAVFIITSILGIVAYSRTVKPFIITYLIANLALFIAFFVIFIVFFNKQISIQQSMSQENCQTGLLGKADEVYNKARKVWCRRIPEQSISCPCMLLSKQKWSEDDQEQIMNEYNAVKSNGSKQVQDCAESHKYIPDLASQLPFLKLIEEQYNCNGICDQGDYFYYFSDINRGPPSKKTCLEEIKQKIINWTQLIYIYSCAAFSFAFFNIVICKFIIIQFFNSYQYYHKRFIFFFYLLTFLALQDFIHLLFSLNHKQLGQFSQIKKFFKNSNFQC